MKTNVYLIGFMGCGKTIIGKELATQMGYPFRDIDEVIEDEEQVPIPDIFKVQGEAYFRDVESKWLMHTKEMNEHVISTGGGIISREANREFLKGQQTIYLEWDFETLYKRIKDDVNRPNVKSYDQLKSLYTSRITFYENTATYCIKCEGKSIQEIALEIIKELGGGG